MQYFHIPDVVNVNTLRQTHNQTMTIHAYTQNLRRINTITNVLFLLEMQHFQTVRFLGGNKHHQRTIEETFHDANILGIVLVEDLIDFIRTVDREQTQAVVAQHRNRAGREKLKIRR